MRTLAQRSGDRLNRVATPHLVAQRPGRRELQKVVEYKPTIRFEPFAAVGAMLASVKQALFEIGYWIGFGRTGYLEGRNVRNQTLTIIAIVAMVLLVCTSKTPNVAKTADAVRPVEAKAQQAVKTSESEQPTEISVEGAPPSSQQSRLACY